MPLQRLICYYDSRDKWLANAKWLGLSPVAVRELAYLLPVDTEVTATFEDISSLLNASGVKCFLVEASDRESLAAITRETSENSLLWNMTDGFFPVTASYFPAYAAMMRAPYFGNSSALQLSIQNKYIQFLMCDALGIPTPPTALYDADNYLSGIKVFSDFEQLIVKPFNLANSIGIFGDSICSTLQAAIDISVRIKSHYGTKSLIQGFISGETVRVNYVGVNKAVPIHEGIGAHLMRGPPEETGFISFEEHYRRFALADAEYAAKAVPINLDEQRPKASKYQNVVAGIRVDTEKLVGCFSLRDFFSMDYRITDDGKRYFIELNTLPFVRNAALRAYCREMFGLSVGQALGTAMLGFDMNEFPQEW